MKKYRHIFFDLDHTLWDYDSNVRDSLSDLFVHYRLEDFGEINFDSFFEAFLATNHELWDLFNQGKVDQSELRKIRFRKVFTRANLSPAHIPVTLEQDFVSQTSSRARVMDHTFEILDYLRDAYALHIITNGFNESQYSKLKHSGLAPYFELVVTSESSGFRKPDKRIFYHALEKLGSKAEDCLMIGDNPNSDILGAKNASIDQVYYNPLQKKDQVQSTFTISHLSELRTIL
ncbi:putative hydrolase of the HAD superfamily [Cyclobacterium lianum]|uniref:Putative hydrolase of the HAD superfamily n=1 Tax=Cyclobacterium lianum TaxID=388280 RepID=A0A1M7K227_9BACT|nr:YjjG family noncanonical pyrimidine nucleotidase [Cyclobacterium lianum]SHM59264.1 putative hydrolase of the HAD superfamily [Cyclobacterium lianum]